MRLARRRPTQPATLHPQGEVQREAAHDLDRLVARKSVNQFSGHPLAVGLEFGCLLLRKVAIDELAIHRVLRLVESVRNGGMVRRDCARESLRIVENANDLGVAEDSNAKPCVDGDGTATARVVKGL